ncbi:MAG: 1-acyl-sn-glycerol-3-phosphate acyltransferase [Bernardetiaceae bacterium]|jgi:1-acyl-sn-glycerol-3-phosphate acyltransferase|nr:1-acyl-sn-glycerol-3-phosphate acyltransferase [Bernardetiaceae bacterium]
MGVIKTICGALLKANGWVALDNSGRVALGIRKFVIIVVPHTSNWDFWHVNLARYWLGYGQNTKFLGKSSLFKPPFGWLFYAMGGTPVQRDRRSNLVEQVVAKFAQADELGIVLAPEGTRRYIADWKTGFYQIAVQAGVPILPVTLDYPQRRIEILPAFYPTGDQAVDWPRLKAPFKKSMAKFPANYQE